MNNDVISQLEYPWITISRSMGDLSSSEFSSPVFRRSTGVAGVTEQALDMWKQLLLEQHRDTQQLVTTIRGSLQEIQHSKNPPVRWLR